MNPKRKQRLYLTLFLLLVAGGVTALLIQISGENMNMSAKRFEPAAWCKRAVWCAVPRIWELPSC
jgi:hypothetical protein